MTSLQKCELQLPARSISFRREVPWLDGDEGVGLLAFEQGDPGVNVIAPLLFVADALD